MCVGGGGGSLFLLLLLLALFFWFLFVCFVFAGFFFLFCFGLSVCDLMIKNCVFREREGERVANTWLKMLWM